MVNYFSQRSWCVVITCGDQSSSCIHVQGQTVQPRPSWRDSNLSLHNLEQGWTSGEEDQVCSCSTLLLIRHESSSRQKLILFPCLFLPIEFFLYLIHKSQMKTNVMYDGVCLRGSHHQNSAYACDRVPEKCFCQEH